MISKIFARCFFATLLFTITSFSPVEDEVIVPAFKTVTIGADEWMAENLNVSHFRNGDAIFEANTYEEWEYASIKGLPAWCYYNNNPGYGRKYGKLYNGWAIRDKRGLGPEGWHVPTEKEWDQLTEELGGVESAGGKIRSAHGWTCKSTGDDNGFSALPGGYRTHEMPKYYGGPFFDAGNAGYWWSATGYVVDNIWIRTLSCENSSLDKTNFDRTAGMAVRLVKDGN